MVAVAAAPTTAAVVAAGLPDVVCPWQQTAPGTVQQLEAAAPGAVAGDVVVRPPSLPPAVGDGADDGDE